ncbi:MAG: hypothetical protein HC802_04785 [Caldilineaceae bacterium]|nr:hypothetical protein [Caldilineaceae bacterium]
MHSCAAWMRRALLAVLMLILLAGCVPGDALSSALNATNQTRELKRSVEVVYGSQDVDANGSETTHQFMFRFTSEPPSQ